LHLNPLKAAAQSQGVEVIVAAVDDASELETVITLNRREPNSGLIAMSDAFLNVYPRRSHRWPLAAVSLPFIHIITSSKSVV
jgi:hypothetical protein